MLYLFDTNTFSDAMGANPKVMGRLASLSMTDRVIPCAIVMGEVWYGIERLPASKRRKNLITNAMVVSQIIPCEPIPPSAGEHYARTRAFRERQGTRTDGNDLWVVATTLAVGAVLVSRDSDVQNVPNLLVEDWTR